MRIVTTALAELVGLFVDDGSLALALIAWCAAVGLSTTLLPWSLPASGPALFAGCAAHSILPLEQMLSGAVGLLFLITGHMEEWPVAKGGSSAVQTSEVKITERPVDLKSRFRWSVTSARDASIESLEKPPTLRTPATRGASGRLARTRTAHSAMTSLRHR